MSGYDGGETVDAGAMDKAAAVDSINSNSRPQASLFPIAGSADVQGF